MTKDSKDAQRARADAWFRKPEVAPDAGARAKAQHDAELEAIRKRSARLRAERLAREKTTT